MQENIPSSRQSKVDGGAKGSDTGVRVPKRVEYRGGTVAGAVVKYKEFAPLIGWEELQSVGAT